MMADAIAGDEEKDRDEDKDSLSAATLDPESSSTHGKERDLFANHVLHQ